MQNYSYLEIMKQLKNRIEKNIYQYNEKIPSERNLTAEFSVSRTTIRKAINQLTEDNYLIKYPGKGTFVSYQPGQNKAKSKTGNIFFLRCRHGKNEVTGQSEDPLKYNSQVADDIFYPQVVAGIDLVAEAKEYHCLFKYIYEEDINQKLAADIEAKADGIICGELHSEKMLKTISELNLPVVLISPSVLNDKVDIVDIDNYTGALTLTEHLITLGHTNFAFIAGSEDSRPSQQRKNGFEKALKNHNLQFDSHNYFENGWRFEDGYQAAQKILDLEELPTAVVAVSDLIAIGAISAFKDSGLKIPQDIAVVGFDDIDMAGQIRPTLTTMKVRKVEMGQEAAQLLLNKINGNSRNYPIKITVPTKLIKRDSTAKFN